MDEMWFSLAEKSGRPLPQTEEVDEGRVSLSLTLQTPQKSVNSTFPAKVAGRAEENKFQL